MEPITSVALGYAADKLVSVAEFLVKTHVIERWSRYRAQTFFEAFCTAIVDVSATDDELREKLDELMIDDARSQVVFEAYRSVCLSKSRSIGPRVIAFLTAEIVLSGSAASEDDEQIFSVAETLSDNEFEELHAFVHAELEKAESPPSSGAWFHIEIRKETSSASSSNALPYIAPLDYALYVGSWAVKLKQFGLLGDEVKERSWRYSVDTERHIDEDGIAREVKWILAIGPAARRLAIFAQRAGKGADRSSK
jgi:hypothetical protein